MERYVRFDRRELVWESREVTWDKNDYANLLGWLEKRATEEQEKDDGNTYFIGLYEVLKTLTWDNICDIIDYKVDDVEFKYTINWKDEVQTYSIRENVLDFIREDVFQADIYDEDYADDYDEDIRVLEEGQPDYWR